jgi:anaphase-promoting complex subunit 10
MVTLYANETAPSFEDSEGPPALETEAESIHTAEPQEEQDAEEEEEGDDATNVADTNGTSSSAIMAVAAVPNLDSLYGLREIGREALCWQLSSAKPGNGVEQIRDQSTETYWQSDGTSQPHFLQVHFARRVAISHVCLYLDYSLDESYTPKTVRVECGMTNQDLVPAVHPSDMVIGLNEPSGWCIIPLQSPPDPLDEEEEEEDDDEDNDNDNNGEDKDEKKKCNKIDSSRKMVRAHLIRISVDQMHQNGRDTHIRQVQLYGPRRNANLSRHPATVVSALSSQLQHLRPVGEADGGEDAAMQDVQDPDTDDGDGDDDDSDVLMSHHGQRHEEFSSGGFMQQYSMIR